jgi:hypothetical protein
MSLIERCVTKQTIAVSFFLSLIAAPWSQRFTCIASPEVSSSALIKDKYKPSGAQNAAKKWNVNLMNEADALQTLRRGVHPIWQPKHRQKHEAELRD